MKGTELHGYRAILPDCCDGQTGTVFEVDMLEALKGYLTAIFDRQPGRKGSEKACQACTQQRVAACSLAHGPPLVSSIRWPLSVSLSTQD